MSILSLLRAIPADPTAEDLDPVVDALLKRSGPKPFPLKSVAAVLRVHREPARLDEKLIREIMSRAGRAATALRPRSGPAAAEPAAYCGETRAAAVLGISVSDLRTRMIDPLQRRAHGYPHWDGREFRFPLAALLPEVRHGYLEGLPLNEPLQELLPEWCRRGG